MAKERKEVKQKYPLFASRYLLLETVATLALVAVPAQSVELRPVEEEPARVLATTRCELVMLLRDEGIEIELLGGMRGLI